MPVQGATVATARTRVLCPGAAGRVEDEGYSAVAAAGAAVMHVAYSLRDSHAGFACACPRLGAQVQMSAKVSCEGRYPG